MRFVVLGAGVAGIATAYELHADGHEVVVVDASDGAANVTSAGNAGLIAPGHAYTWASPKAPRILIDSLYKEHTALKFKPSADPELYRWSLRFLKNCRASAVERNTAIKLGLCVYSQERLREVTRATGVEYDLLSKGLIYVYRTAATYEAGVAKMDILQRGGRRMRAVDTDEAIRLEPTLAGARDTIAGGIYVDEDESGDCRAFTKNLAAWLEARGVEFRWNTTITGFGTAGSRVTDVRTSRGPVRGDHYVLSLGCASAKLGRQLGLRLPIYPIKGYSLTLPIEDHHEAPDMGGVDENQLVAWARFGDKLRLTATAEFAGYDTSHSPEDFDGMLACAKGLFPNAADWSRPEYWAGLRPMTPEGTPIMGPSKHENMWLNTGHGHMGWTMACGSARLAVDMIKGTPTAVDVTGMTL